MTFNVNHSFDPKEEQKTQNLRKPTMQRNHFTMAFPLSYWATAEIHATMLY